MTVELAGPPEARLPLHPGPKAPSAPVGAEALDRWLRSTAMPPIATSSAAVWNSPLARLTSPGPIDAVGAATWESWLLIWTLTACDVKSSPPTLNRIRIWSWFGAVMLNSSRGVQVSPVTLDMELVRSTIVWSHAAPLAVVRAAAWTH